jgi:DnaJ family protein A protein 2
MSEQDHYKILNIDKLATDSDIKKAYKQKALQCHPDRGGNQEEFKKVAEAYSILSDPQKRNIYDSGGQSNIHNHMHTHNSAHDIFSQFFGNHFGNVNNVIKKCNTNYVVNVSLGDIHFGVKKNLKVSLNKKCCTCKTNCNTCGGSGQQQIRHQMGPFIQIINQPCNICNMSGIIFNKNINCNCKSGIIEEERIILLEIPQGTKNDINFVFHGLGEQPVKHNEVPGDLLCQINTIPHELFKRVGETLDLEIEFSISFLESIIGKNIIINHFDGLFNINTNVFGVINPTQKYIIKNKGLHLGDLIVQFNVIYPKKIELNNESIKMLENLFN